LILSFSLIIKGCGVTAFFSSAFSEIDVHQATKALSRLSSIDAEPNSTHPNKLFATDPIH
jgi:hypothetical protein